MKQDTIAAVATPKGTGGVAIIRISGDNAHAILKKVFSKKAGFSHAKMMHGYIEKDGNILDEVMAVVFDAPKSFTGEHVAEIHCHGSVVGTEAVLKYIYECGAAPAAPGEFTRRAFMNGKMDLTQAEAVSDYIFARSAAAAKMSMKQMGGGLKEKISTFQDTLRDLLAETYAAIEYPEEDLELGIAQNALPSIRELCGKIEKLAHTFELGRIINQGLDVAIAGKPNAGKSSLLNALLDMDRAIVADVPGTTRDTIEHSFYINEIAINIKDTAGIRSTKDIIENEGVKRAKNAINESGLIVFVLDEQAGIEQEDRAIFEGLKDRVDDTIIVLNKIDASEGLSEMEGFAGREVLRVSAKTGEGIERLKKAIYDFAVTEDLNEDILVTNARHRQLLETAAAHLRDAEEALLEGVDMDCVTIDLNSAWEALGEITGRTVSEEIIDRIFEKFCLGK